MADFIIHHEGAYNIFGTIADGPHYVSALTLDQLREVIKAEHGERGLETLALRLERAHAHGCSGHGWTLDDCISANRWTGDGEGPPGAMPREDFIARYLTLPAGVSAVDDAQDAARYRWLRAQRWDDFPTGEALDRYTDNSQKLDATNAGVRAGVSPSAGEPSQ